MLGLACVHHVLELRHHVLGDVALLVGEPQRVVPLVERIVDAHVQARCGGRPPSGRAAISRLGPISTAFHGRPHVSFASRAPPQREAFVVLRGQRDVLRAGALEDVGPVVGIVELGAEHRREIEVREVGAVDPLVEFPGGTVGLRVLR